MRKDVWNVYGRNTENDLQDRLEEFWDSQVREKKGRRENMQEYETKRRRQYKASGQIL